MKKVVIFIGLVLLPCIVSAQLFIGGSHIKSVTLKNNGELEVVEVKPSPFRYPEGGSPPGTAIKYIYAAKGGKIYLKEKVKGQYYPESFKTVPEHYEFK